MARIFVGMSGGVDSSVATALLARQGHEVTGVYMKNWSRDLPGMRCPWAEDLADAKRVAVQLGIDFQVFDFEAEYKQRVVDAMVAEYQAGRTPNPDVMCNQEIKFKLFLETALEKGADLIATGHYAQTGGLEPSSDYREDALYQAKDKEKDQTYFLYRVTSEALSKTLFPLGDLTKQQVRQLAKEYKLWTADKKESMGICFIGQVGIADFLAQYINLVPGDIIDSDTQQVVGRHDGAVLYTIGQRHGLNVGGGLPYYVIGKDIAKNQVFVSRDLNSSAIWSQDLEINDLNWINQPPGQQDQLTVRLRHRGKLIAIEDLSLADNWAKIRLVEPERAITPGQSAVIYDKKRVVGGGIVARVD